MTDLIESILEMFISKLQKCSTFPLSRSVLNCQLISCSSSLSFFTLLYETAGKKNKTCTHLLQVVNQCCVVHIKKETHQWHPQSHVTSLNSLILTVEFPLDSGCAVAEATAILFKNCFNCSYSSIISSVVRTCFFFPFKKHRVTKTVVRASRIPYAVGSQPVCILAVLGTPDHTLRLAKQ